MILKTEYYDLSELADLLDVSEDENTEILESYISELIVSIEEREKMILLNLSNQTSDELYKNVHYLKSPLLQINASECGKAIFEAERLIREKADWNEIESATHSFIDKLNRLKISLELYCS